MKKINRLGLKLALGISLLAAATGAQASKVITDNPDDRFARTEASDPGIYTDPLTKWLGKGSLTLTSIFTMSAWADNHVRETGERRYAPYPAELEALVAGKGPTFTIMHVAVAELFFQSAVIGWYNPLNGVTAAGGNAGENSYDAFIFNFTSNRVLRPEYNPMYSDEQRVSNTGAAYDLYMDEIPRVANSIMDTYSDELSYSDNSIRGLLWSQKFPRNFNSYSMSIVDLAVYSISVDSLAAASAVPETGTWVMMIVGFGLIGGMARRRRGGARALKPATDAASNA